MSDKNNNSKPTYSTLQNLRYLIGEAWLEDKALFAIFVTYTLLAAVSPLASVIFPRFILQELIGEPRVNVLVQLLAGFFAATAICGFGMSYFNAKAYPRILHVRLQIMLHHFRKCMTTDFKNTEDRKFLDDSQTSFRCVENSGNGVENIFVRLFEKTGGIFALAGFTAIISTLNIFVLLFLVANVAVTYFTAFAVRKYEHSKKDDVSDKDRRSNYLYNVMYDFSYGKELRLYNLRERIGNMYAHFRKQRLDIHRSVKWREFAIGLLDITLSIVREGIVYAYLIYLVFEGRIGIPDFTMYFAAIAGFSKWLNELISNVANIRGENLSICDFRNFIGKRDTMDTDNPRPIPAAPYTIEFRNVSFKYPSSDEYVYKNLNLKIAPKQKLAIVGHNGAGKTTFVKLLCRLYDVTDGEILLNGINIKEFDKQEYYKLFAAVFQELRILAFSAAENIALTESGSIDRARVQYALDNADIAEKVASLPKGMDTALQKILDDEGVELSGGQNQKITIARALYKNSAIMALDEPTAALDALAEHNIYMSFNKMVEDKTAVYISHRLASTRFCDIIAMFEKGELVEYGTHDELLAKGGKYAEMFNVQAQYYQEEDAA